MRDGWIKLWRKSLGSSTWQNIKLWRMWEYCLLKANHEENMAMVGFQEVRLEPGQFVFGRKKASQETGLSEQSVRTTMKHLENLQNLTTKPTNKFTIVTICNWRDYQGQLTSDLTNKPTSTQPASNQQVTTNKNVKNVKKEKKNIYGEFKNVKLTTEEYEKLSTKLTKLKTDKLIESLSEYIASKGKRYNSHYATILQWAKRERRGGDSYGI